jgi:MbtH protein
VRAVPVTDKQYAVVVNDEEQCWRWHVGEAVPAGWVATGFMGTKAECADHIDRVWTDMRPQSLRTKVACS